MRHSHKAESERAREQRAQAREIEREVKALNCNNNLQFTCVWIEFDREGAQSETNAEREDERTRECVKERETDRERQQAKESEREQERERETPEIS